MRVESRLSVVAVDFGDQDLGKRSATREVALENGGGSPVTIVSLEIDGAHAKDFRLTDATTCSPQQPVESGNACVLAVSFRPTALGDRTARLVIRLADGDGPASVELRGAGSGEAAVVLETTRLDFGSVSLGKGRRTRQLTLTNAGNAPLAVSEAAGSRGSTRGTSGSRRRPTARSTQRSRRGPPARSRSRSRPASPASARRCS